MRTHLKTVIPLSLAAQALALAVSPNLDVISIPVALHSEYVLAGSNEKIQLWSQNFGEVIPTIHLDGNFTPTAHFQRLDRALLERDICARITDCAGQAASSAKAWAYMAATVTVNNCNGVANAVNTYLSDRDYGETRKIIAGSVLGLAIALGGTVPQYFINAKLEATYGNSQGRNDVCSQRDPPKFASDAASAVYEFCISIKNEKQSEATTNFDTMDMTDVAATTTGGFEGRAKLFISEQAGTWGKMCHDDYGIDWKRQMLAI